MQLQEGQCCFHSAFQTQAMANEENITVCFQRDGITMLVIEISPILAPLNCIQPA